MLIWRGRVVMFLGHLGHDVPSRPLDNSSMPEFGRESNQIHALSITDSRLFKCTPGDVKVKGL